MPTGTPPLDITTHDFQGEKSSYNQQDVPQGSLDEGYNVAIRRPNQMEPFRGFDFLGSALASPPVCLGKVSQGSFVALGTGTGSGSFVAFDPLGLVSVTPVSQTLGNQVLGNPYPGVYPSAVPFANTVWFNGKFGAYRLDFGTNTPGVNGYGTGSVAPVKPAALPPPVVVASSTYNQLGPGIAITVTGGSGSPQFAEFQSIGYFATVLRIDSYNNQRRSEPSSRILVNLNTPNPTVNIYVNNSHMLTTDCVIELWRTRTALPIPPNTFVDPGTDAYLVAQFPVVPASINFGPSLYGFVPTDGYNGAAGAYIDATPDNALGPPLYTNSSVAGGGIQNAATDPPRAGVMFSYANRMYYGNVESYQAIPLTYIGGMTAGTTIIVNGHTYTAGTDFTIYSGASTFNNITNTAQSIVNAVNQWEMGLGFFALNTAGGLQPPENRIMAQYVSGAGTPGQMLFRRLMPGAAPFTLLPSSFASFGAKPPGNIYTSDPSKQTAGIYWSTQQEPDTVPLANNTRLGATNNTILGACATRDFAMVATDANLFMVQETFNGPQFTPFDSTVVLVSQRSMVAMSNLAYMLTNKGVLRMSNQGPEFLGDPIIENLLNDAARPGILNTAIGIAYESESEYWLFIPNGPGDTSCSFARVYNEKTRAWTTWDAIGHVVAGAELPLNGLGQKRGLVFSVASGNGGVPSGPATTWSGLLHERKGLNAYDYQLPNWTVSMSQYITAGAPTLYQDKGSGYDLLVLASGNTTIKQGDILRASNPACAIQTAYVYGVVNYSTGDYVILKGIQQLVNNSSGLESTDDGAATDWATNNPGLLTVVPCVLARMRFLPFTGGEDHALTRKIWVSNTAYSWFRDCPMSFIGYRWDTEYDNTTQLDYDSAAALPAFYGNTFIGSTFNSFGRASQDYVNNFTVDPAHAKSALLALTLYLGQALAPWDFNYFKLEVGGALENVTFRGNY
jgi:hypothetical protein